MREPTPTLRDLSESVMRRVVGNRIGSEVLTIGRVEIANDAREEIQDAMDRYDNGLHIITVELQDVVPPQRVQPAFNEVNEARQELERMINEANRSSTRRYRERKARRTGHCRSRRLCDRTRQPGAGRDGAFQRGARRVPRRARSDALAPLPRGTAHDVATGRLGGRHAGRPGAAAAESGRGQSCGALSDRRTAMSQRTTISDCGS
jgi:hypothetical protein